MRNFVTLLLTVLLFTAIVNAQDWNVAGDMNGWDNTGNPMYDDGTNGDPVANDGIYTTIINIATSGRYEWKVSLYGSWDESYPTSNAFLYTTTAGQDVIFTFDTNTYTDGWQPDTYIVNANDQVAPVDPLVAVGDHNGWNNAGPEVMHDDGMNGDLVAGDGIYTYQQTIATPGTYGWKATLSGTWDAWGSDGRGTNSVNGEYTTTTNDEDIYFHLDVINGRILASDVSVPVELVSFNAQVSDNNVNLSWRTSTETNNKGFDIERSVDNNNFESIAFIEGNGTTTQTQSYSYTDNNLNDGVYYYRLKQSDYDGSISYSDVVEIEISTPINFELSQNYPNPFNPSTVIKYQIPVAGKVTLSVYNVQGKEVSSLVNEYKEAGSYEVNFNASDLSSGVYFYRITTGNNVSTKMMMLLK